MWKKKWFGFWKQDGENYQKCPDINEWTDTKHQEAYKQIVNFLEGGSFVVVSPVNTICHLCNKSINTSKVILTDGIWMWPKDLSHYILFHNLQLPDEFKEHIKNCNYTCPEVDKEFDVMELEHP